MALEGTSSTLKQPTLFSVRVIYVSEAKVYRKGVGLVVPVSTLEIFETGNWC